MPSIFIGSVPWHDGEEKVHQLLRVPLPDNPTVPGLSPNGANFLRTAPLMAVGTIDSQGRPWTTLWGGKSGFAEPVGQSMIRLRTQVDNTYDPVAKMLFKDQPDEDDGGIFNETQKMISGLAIDLEQRRRWKLFGRMVAGTLTVDRPGQADVVVKIEESLGNCPKYLNKRHIVPAESKPKLVSDSPQLTPAAIKLISRANTIFVSSRHDAINMDTNIRGGPPGFVRVESNTTKGAVLLYPEYSGNRLYQTLGNLQTTPLAGYVIPDFDSGDVLYVTGHTEILAGKDAAAVLPRSNLAVRLTLTVAIFVENGLAFRGETGEPSPYNPAVRYLPTERSPISAENSSRTDMSATLIKKEVLTPNINRFRFRVSSSKPLTWTPGQYATMSFKDELDMGYSHMRDDDPTSLNDDYVRTFTVSSYPGRELPANEFELMIRRHGNVTDHLFRTNERAGLEAPLKGFGGSFRLSTDDGSIVPFVAGGIGITPFLAQLPDLEFSLVRLFWSVSSEDLGLVYDTFQRWPRLFASTTLFITGGSAPSDANRPMWDAIAGSDAQVHRRRMGAADLEEAKQVAQRWYLCAGIKLKQSVLGWLVGKDVVYEDFDY
ncbi:Riboflavin synthase-like beta-barrel [Penicillium argentinense]|uniref:Riboflavin synthase-like beta-barrel n=1 Tax=Penicillium argentinense TaxID=1131581 RepID=A0A9W9EXW8_9EURO|nr:Riboflavin synthase-like beta-barrel [Penicillium argentinense]KAJ5090007.1 Riboflavin synthase-like beta-barrel [Penicillium argentinense]